MSSRFGFYASWSVLSYSGGAYRVKHTGVGVRIRGNIVSEFREGEDYSIYSTLAEDMAHEMFGMIYTNILKNMT